MSSYETSTLDPGIPNVKDSYLSRSLGVGHTQRLDWRESLSGSGPGSLFPNIWEQHRATVYLYVCTWTTWRYIYRISISIYVFITECYMDCIVSWRLLVISCIAKLACWWTILRAQAWSLSCGTRFSNHHQPIRGKSTELHGSLSKCRSTREVDEYPETRQQKKDPYKCRFTCWKVS